MICGVYKITSPSGRVYVGESVNIDKRLKEYLKLRNCESQTILYKSFLKHGVENHIFEIIEECCKEDLKCKERYWQDFYDVLNGGLNCLLTKCGEKKQTSSDHTKAKISKANSGANNYFYGKKHTKESSEKMSLTRKSSGMYVGGKNPKAKLVLDICMGIYYDSLIEASHTIHIKYGVLRAMLNPNKKYINRTNFIYC